MVDIGGGTLLEHQVRCLRDAGVKPAEITVITGHGRRLVDQLASRLGCRSLFNPQYASANNVVSVHCFVTSILGQRERPREVLLINSDTFAHSEIFRAFVKSDLGDAAVLDASGPLDEEAMKVAVRDGSIRCFSKQLPAAAADGEYIGLARFGPDGLLALADALADIIHSGGVDSWYEDAFNRAIETTTMGCLYTRSLPWIEIDTPDDYRQALLLASRFA